jgi:hypothetical protein
MVYDKAPFLPQQVAGGTGRTLRLVLWRPCRRTAYRPDVLRGPNLVSGPGALLDGQFCIGPGGIRTHALSPCNFRSPVGCSKLCSLGWGRSPKRRPARDLLQFVARGGPLDDRSLPNQLIPWATRRLASVCEPPSAGSSGPRHAPGAAQAAHRSIWPRPRGTAHCARRCQL